MVQILYISFVKTFLCWSLKGNIVTVIQEQLLRLDWSFTARVLLTCTAGILKYTYMYPGYGKYTKTYPGILTLNRQLSAIFFINYVHIHVKFSVQWPLYYQNSYSKSMLIQFVFKDQFVEDKQYRFRVISDPGYI